MCKEFSWKDRQTHKSTGKFSSWFLESEETSLVFELKLKSEIVRAV